MTKLAVLVGLFLVLAVDSYALDGVDYIDFNIKGKTYSAPIPNKETRQTFRELKEALNGDELSREFLLGGQEMKMIYIGDVGVIRWVKVTKDDIDVIEVSNTLK